ncbi:alpha/beta fold hydrolase [Brevundimonas subvibrioides]|uniref:Alpha/beta hydrolase fold protein n=1 Tax=Brevundimonas subvibrioides (strain ATCC 15264 / DSM 4735 / LMG 14903 / NBRC 16000 / CB 81) TaxID=633149 RepID=D9QMQ4_BRESC|nr:alpha/beta hydrolase [Brevundimonas subvibrioides]ADL00224.1 alpha/beta hydrolase fold protein [Brevundimonas subvibrioides ATCC 15264]
MRFQTAFPRCRRPLAWFPVIVAIVVACSVGQHEAKAEPFRAAQTAPFSSDRLSVEVIGTGPDVILIPGLASSREVWRPLATRLAATHRVHLVQLAGFAGEPWSHSDGPFVQPEVDDLARYIAEAGLDRPAVIGHSMGGLSGLLLAQQHPDRVGRLMIVDALPFYSAIFGPTATAESARPFAARFASGMLAADDATFRSQQAQSAMGLARDPAMRETMVAWSMASDRQALAAALTDVMTTDARPGLANMATPVTAVYATDADGGPPPAMAQGLWTQEYASLPGVTLIAVDGSRHFIMADQPARFDQLVDDFLK